MSFPKYHNEIYFQKSKQFMTWQDISGLKNVIVEESITTSTSYILHLHGSQFDSKLSAFSDTEPPNLQSPKIVWNTGFTAMALNLRQKQTGSSLSLDLLFALDLLSNLRN